MHRPASEPRTPAGSRGSPDNVGKLPDGFRELLFFDLMHLGLSTHWNAGQHRTGESLVDEILGLGFTHVELGYDLTMDLVPGVLARVRAGAVEVGSVHNFCPVPVGAPQGHPELFELSSLDPRARDSAVRHTTRTIEFAAEAGARLVVAHAGNVDMKNLTNKLLDLCNAGKLFGLRYDKIKMELLLHREERSRKHMEAVCRSLDELMPVLDRHGVTLAFENLPSWEAVPTESEMEKLLARYPSPGLAFWFDTGHGQIREDLGFVSCRRWLDRLAPRLAGFHIHDTTDCSHDHLMPPKGKIDFSAYGKYLREGLALVLEPAPRTPAADIVEARTFLQGIWPLADPATRKESTP